MPPYVSRSATRVVGPRRVEVYALSNEAEHVPIVVYNAFLTRQTKRGFLLIGPLLTLYRNLSLFSCCIHMRQYLLKRRSKLSPKSVRLTICYDSIS